VASFQAWKAFHSIAAKWRGSVYLMPRYLYEASYTAEGSRGLLNEGGSIRQQAVEEVARSIGAKVEAFYFVLGDPDVLVIVDAPDNIHATAVSLIVNASGAVRVKTSVLITAAELDEAAKKSPHFRPPGS
jgi:uncharacterized protein with GYD domain